MYKEVCREVNGEVFRRCTGRLTGRFTRGLQGGNGEIYRRCACSFTGRFAVCDSGMSMGLSDVLA